ncbi:MFS transporter [Chitinophaga pinensis]|uniref:MFS transporter n=1 Tax=Chitinophaga pinensis TaxID=79329 RepID=UPI0016446159|nr:MFS transporter [Chitinophaga pinensis]
MLIYGCFLILGGKLSDYIGRKTVFLWGATIFLLTSLGAGLSHTYHALLIFRTLQGLGAALIMPSAFSIVNYYSLTRRNAAEPSGSLVPLQQQVRLQGCQSAESLPVISAGHGSF